MYKFSTDKIQEAATNLFDSHKLAEDLIIDFESIFEKTIPSPTYQLRYAFTHFIRGLKSSDDDILLKSIENATHHVHRAHYDVAEIFILCAEKEFREFFNKYSYDEIHAIYKDEYLEIKGFFDGIKDKLAAVKKEKKAEGLNKNINKIALSNEDKADCSYADGVNIDKIPQKQDLSEAAIAVYSYTDGVDFDKIPKTQDLKEMTENVKKYLREIYAKEESIKALKSANKKKFLLPLIISNAVAIVTAIVLAIFV